MGRLFWKFFTFFWLAQIIAFFSVALFFLISPYAFASWFPICPVEAPIDDSKPAIAFLSPALPPARLGGHLSFIPRPYPWVVGILVSLAFAAWLSWYFSRPIRSLRAAFEALAAGKLNTRVGDTMGRRRDELTDLGAAFDKSAEKLQALMEAQRRLLHDVSHELRSPLARLQACSDLMLQQPQRADELIHRIVRETGRMDALVGELLTLARLDSGAQAINRDTINLVEVVQSVCDDAFLELQAKGCTVRIERESSGWVKGDGVLLYRAIDNILRNAIHYTRNDSIIVLRISEDRHSSNVLLCISDHGPGLYEGDLVSIFEPFFRSGQTDQPHGDGYGLGLAITRSIVHSHEGRLIARNREHGGLDIEVSLPAAMK